MPIIQPWRKRVWLDSVSNPYGKLFPGAEGVPNEGALLN